MIRILVIDDHPLFRLGLTSVLKAYPDFEVVGEASNAVEGMAVAAKLQPDVVTMDIYMRGGDGFEGTAKFRERFPNVKILIVSMSNSEEDLFKLMKAGAHGYLLKTVGCTEVVESIRNVAAGESALSPSMAIKLVEGFRTSARDNGGKDLHNLSGREKEILQLAAKGSTNKEIADTCFISETTVKAHFRNILEKLGVRNRAGAVAVAASKGLLAERR